MNAMNDGSRTKFGMTESWRWTAAALFLIAGIPGAVDAAQGQSQALLGRDPVRLYGGGATLPAMAYIGRSFYSASNPGNSARLTSTPDAGSLFAVYTARSFAAAKAEVSYCQTGSSIGRAVFTGSMAASGSCPNFASIPSGFAAPEAAPDFAASDLPLSAGEYSLALSTRGAAHTQPVQFPVLAAAIGIVYRNADITTQLALDDTQLCGLFNGAINNWNQLGPWPAKAIRIVYRSDGSGATFALSNHLSTVCGPPGAYRTDAGFRNVVTPLPARSIAASGNPAVVTAIAATDGSLGYAELADALLRAPSLNYARVGGFDPLADLAAPAIVTAADMSIAGTDSGTGRPTMTAVTPPATGRAGCLLIATPDSIARPGGYPIVAISYLLGYYSGNLEFRALRALFGAAFDNRIRRDATSIRAGSGFAFLAYDPSSTIDRCIVR